MAENNEPSPSRPNRPNIVWDIVAGAAIGTTFILALGACRARLTAWRKGIKAEYSEIVEGSRLAGGATGGGLWSLLHRDQVSGDTIDLLAASNEELRSKIDHKPSTSFAQQVTEEKLNHDIQPSTRS